MAAGFKAIPLGSILRLSGASVPAALLDADLSRAAVSPDGLVKVDIDLRDGLVDRVAPAAPRAPA
ncbi:MAG TPA: hypothetical protein VIJ19_02220, partial [Opitutaceae bacterium]